MRKVIRLSLLIMTIIQEVSQVNSKHLKDDQVEPTSNTTFIKRFHESAGKPDDTNLSLPISPSLPDDAPLSAFVEQIPSKIRKDEQ